MHHYRQGLGLGRRWLQCGWRLLLRNPWLLGGMGVVASTLITALKLVPVIGSLLVAGIAPVLLASAYLAIDDISRQKLNLPARLRMAALKQSPRAVWRVLQAERHLVPMALIALASTGVALLINMMIELVAGSAWSRPWTGLAPIPLASVLVLTVLALLVYSLAAAALAYALPLVFLRGEALVPAATRSFAASRVNATALLVVWALALLPYALGAVAALLSLWATVVIWLLGGALALPLAATSLYCSYRTVFPVPPTIAAQRAPAPRPLEAAADESA